MSGMDDLMAFLLAQLDEDEQVVARSGMLGEYADWTYDRATFTVRTSDHIVASRRGQSPLLDVDGSHIARYDPARMLHEIAAKRAIIVLHQIRIDDIDDTPPTCRICLSDYQLPQWEPWPCPTMRALTSAYVSRPGYRDEWRP